MEHEGDGDTNCSWCTWNEPQKFGKGIERIGNRGKNRDYPNSFTEISQNTEKSPEDLKKLAVKNQQLTLV